MKSGIKWYFKNSIRVFLIVVAYVAVMSLFFFEEDITKSLCSMIVFAYGIFSFSFSLALYKKDIPLAISMGATRKNIFAGTCFFNLFNALFGVILTAVTAVVLGHRESAVILCIGVVIIIFAANAAGILCGILYRTFGWCAALAAGLVIYCGVMAAVIFEMNIWDGGILAVAGITAALLWCIVMAVHYKTVKHLTF